VPYPLLRRYALLLVGAAEGCDLLILTLKTKSKDRSLVALDSSYRVSNLTADDRLPTCDTALFLIDRLYP
jgi:hypothetical protein